MAKSNTTIYIILGLLDHENLSGYDIKKRIDSIISHFWEVGYGQIYPTLKTMEENGMIGKQPSETNKGPERILYTITEKGREVLKEWLLLPEAKEYTKYEILIKLFFGNRVSTEENLKRIEMFKERHLENLKFMKVFEDNLMQVLSEEEDHLYYYLTVLFGEEIYKAYITWAEKAENILKQSKEQDLQEK